MKEPGYDAAKSKYLVNRFSEGFDFGYQGPIQRRDSSENLPMNPGDEFNVWENMMKETKAGRYAGQYNMIPYYYYIQSPIGLVPKDVNKTRLIFHLSYDFHKYKSVNSYTPDHLCTVKYQDLDHAIQTCLSMIKHMSHFANACKMQYPLNLVLENIEYL